MWALRCVSYEIYQLLADTSILYPIDVLKIWMKTKKSIKSEENNIQPVNKINKLDDEERKKIIDTINKLRK